MNEIRDLIIGIDIGKEYTQICYYDRKAEEARSLSMKVGTSQYEAPGCLCYRAEHDDYCVGLEAEYFAREKGGIMVGNIYDICRRRRNLGSRRRERSSRASVLFLKGNPEISRNSGYRKKYKVFMYHFTGAYRSSGAELPESLQPGWFSG